MSLYSQQWWTEEYASDIVKALRREELKRRHYQGRSPQLSHRRRLVELLFQATESFHLNTNTLHLSVYLLDHFMDNHSIAEQQLYMVTFGCVILAAKMEDRDQLVPRIQMLISRYAQGRYSARSYLVLEAAVLRFFDWKLVLPTAATFAEYYVLSALTAWPKGTGWDGGSRADMEHQFRENVQHFLNMSLLEPRFINCQPSIVAASAVVAAHQAMLPSVPGVYPVTHFPPSVISSCVCLLNQVSQKDEQQKNPAPTPSPDAGYSSQPASPENTPMHCD